jgi:hypothetical protein
MIMTKYLKLFAQAIGMRKSVRRTRHELAKTKGPVAKGWGRPIYSTSKEPSEDKETPTTKSETRRNDRRKQWLEDNPDLNHMSTYIRGTKDNYGKAL